MQTSPLPDLARLNVLPVATILFLNFPSDNAHAVFVQINLHLDHRVMVRL